MVTSSKPSQSPFKDDAAQEFCEEDTHIHVIVCSCSSSALTKNLRFSQSGAKTYITSLPELPHLQDFISNFIPYDSTNHRLADQQTYLQLLSGGGLQVQDLVSRSRKYVRSPLRILGLANRTRIYTQGLLSPRLWFNIAVVITWLLIRRTLEIFGIHLPGLAVTSQKQQATQTESSTKSEEPLKDAKEHDFVHLDAP